MHADKNVFVESPTVCEECDRVNPLPSFGAGQRVNCWHCGHTLVKWPVNVLDRLIGYGIACVLMLILALSFTFLGFSAYGTGQSTTLARTVSTLLDYDYLLLGSILCVALFVLPLVYLLVVMYLAFGLRIKRSLPGMLFLSRWYSVLQPWLLVDVFMVAVLVAMVKLRSMVDISLGHSFWAFCGYALLLDKIVSLVDKRWLWHQVAGRAPECTELRSETARDQGVSGCHCCGAVVTDDHGLCHRCRHTVNDRQPASLQRTLALLFAAIVMYVPANVFPIMDTVSLGNSESSTIIGGVFMLWRMGSYPVALIILLASVLIPLFKIISLFWLCWQCKRREPISPVPKMKLYRVMELIGRWSMIDVFVVATLVGLIQMGNLMSVMPGPAAVPFAAVVVLTMLATKNFDPRLLWDNSIEVHRENIS